MTGARNYNCQRCKNVCVLPLKRVLLYLYSALTSKLTEIAYDELDKEQLKVEPPFSSNLKKEIFLTIWDLISDAFNLGALLIVRVYFLC